MATRAVRTGGVRLAMPVIAAWLAACSSAVSSINDQAALVGPDHTAARPAEPKLMLRRPRTEYQLGPRDVLEIEVYELEEPNKSKQLRMRVSQDGSIVLPLLGPLAAAGRTARELQVEIARRLGDEFLVNPSVNVLVAEHQARRVTALGALQQPGTFFLKDNSTTLIDVLALAGGPSEKAGSVVFVVHEAGSDDVDAVPAALRPVEAARPNIVKVDLVDLVERGDPSANCVLQDGDIVHVPPAPQFFVMGEVKQGGAFPLRGDITLLRAIALAGGLKEEATPSATVLIRTTERGRVTMPIDLNQVEAGSSKDLKMQPDDVLVVSQSGGDSFVRGMGLFFRGLFHVGYSL